MERFASQFPVTLARSAGRAIALIEPEVVAAGRENTGGDEPSSTPASKGQKARRLLVAVLPFLLLLPLFYGFAAAKSKRSNAGNTGQPYDAIFYHDQHAYLNMGKMMRESDYQWAANRHRTPGYSFLLSALFRSSDDYRPEPGGDDPRRISEAYFARAKHFNILLGVISIVVLFLICRRFLPPLESHVVTWSYAWLVAVIKAPYVQPEVSFYVLILLGVVLLWRLLVRPRWWLAAATALVLAAAFLLKGTVLPLIALFVACAGIRSAVILWQARARGQAVDWRGAGRDLAIAMAVPLIFSTLLAPYFRNTAEMYGNPLWDVHSKHYLWMDNHEEKVFWRKAGISDPGFVAPEGRTVPTLASYLEGHGIDEMIDREAAGWAGVRNQVKKEYRAVYDLTRHLTLWILLGAVVLFRRRALGAFRQHWVEWLLVLGFLGGYGLLYCWYQAIGVGPRLILTLFLPAFFFAILGIHRLTAPVALRVFQWQAPLRHVVNAVLLAFIVIGGIGVLTGDLWVAEGGH